MVYKKLKIINIQLYVLYLEKNRLRRRAIHRRMQNLNHLNKLFFAKINTKNSSKLFQVKY